MAKLDAKTGTSSAKADSKEAEISPAPSHFGKRMRKFWVWAHSIRKLSEKDRLILLRACEAFDQGERARLAVKKHGMTCEDRFGQKKLRPEVTVEQISRAQFTKMVAMLGLHPRQAWEPDD